MNKAILVGNLGADPEHKTTPNGISVCTFRVGVRRPHDKDQTDWFTCVAWRGLADNCAKYLQKGSKVGVVGQIQTRQYDDKNGVRRYITEIIADEVEFLTSKGASEGRDEPPHTSADDLFGDELAAFEPVDDAELPF